MSARTALETALQRVPFVSTLGIRVEDARPGRVVLRLPALYDTTAHCGAVHTAALFALGELAAGVAVGSHPDLAALTHYLKASRIAYINPTRSDVTAHAEVPEEAVDAVRSALAEGDRARLELSVRLLDGHGTDIASVISLFQLRR